VGFGWEADDLDGTSGAAVDELFFNEGEFSLTVRAGSRRGALVAAQTAPLLRYPRVRVEARVVDGAASRDDLQVGWDSTGTVVLVSGTMHPGRTRTISLAYRHPADAWRAALTEALARGGITISGRRAVVRSASPVALGAVTSMSFADVLARMEKPSQNQIAEILFRTAGRVRSGTGSADSAQRVVERQLTTWGVSPDQLVVRDGSGLSRHNFVSPTAIVRVLEAMRTHPDFRVFYDALPIAGRDGTIGSRMRGTPAEGNVRAKTGTLSRVRALSGYVTTPDGRTLLMSFFCNNFVTPTREVDRVVDALVAQLATLRLERRE
jgi:serine-type D-Ala-D-Ala carboxypeptidase/endopeptidase (penicillin-binding protein 4)